MIDRRAYEEREEQFLSPYATLAKNSRGRVKPEEEDTLRTCFQRDRDRILHSKSFRRLKHKTHVFISPEGDHYRTRLTHTLEVSQISRTVARGLALNEDLVEAISMGHDLGHTPFGHTGEFVLNQLNPNGFQHRLHSLRMVDHLEKYRGTQGLNLTHEVRDGIVNHSGPNYPYTLEGKIVKICDRVGYINHDIDDSIRAGVLSIDDIPKDLLDVLGYTHSQRIGIMVHSLIENSWGIDDIKMDPVVNQATLDLRAFLFEHVYLNKVVKSEDEKVGVILRQIYQYFKDHPDQLPREKGTDFDGRDVSLDDQITDYIAGMTDQYAVKVWKDLFMPRHWPTF